MRIEVSRVKHPIAPNQTARNTLTNQCMVNRPARTTFPFLSMKRPRKNGLNELPTMGMARWMDTRDSFTVPTASCRASAENTERRVAALSRSTDSDSPYELSNSTGGEPRHKSLIHRIIGDIPEKGDGWSRRLARVAAMSEGRSGIFRIPVLPAYRTAHAGYPLTECSRGLASPLPPAGGAARRARRAGVAREQSYDLPSQRPLPSHPQAGEGTRFRCREGSSPSNARYGTIPCRADGLRSTG